jgi:hypothetical protein
VSSIELPVIVDLGSQLAVIELPYAGKEVIT